MVYILGCDGKEKQEIVVDGYLRGIIPSKHANLVPSDIIRTVILFINLVNEWKISIKELAAQLHQDFTTITGPILSISSNKFIAKLKRSRDRLYFGVWYQGTKMIEQKLRQHFQLQFPYNGSIAIKIVESFKYVIDLEEFDELELIMHDIEDMAYSCILEYVEEKLVEAFSMTAMTINRIKSDIKQIISDFNINGCKAEFINFRVQLQCVELGIDFQKLFRYNKHEIAENAAEWQWRSELNEYKDANISFQRFIECGLEYLTFRSHVDIIEKQGDIIHVREDKSAKYYYQFDNHMVNRLRQMNHGDHVYAPYDFGSDGLISVLFGSYFGGIYILLQQMYPSQTLFYFSCVNFRLSNKLTGWKKASSVKLKSNQTFAENSIYWKIDEKWIGDGVELDIVLS